MFYFRQQRARPKEHTHSTHINTKKKSLHQYGSPKAHRTHQTPMEVNWRMSAHRYVTQITWPMYLRMSMHYTSTKDWVKIKKKKKSGENFGTLFFSSLFFLFAPIFFIFQKNSFILSQSAPDISSQQPRGRALWTLAHFIFFFLVLVCVSRVLFLSTQQNLLKKENTEMQTSKAYKIKIF